MSVCVGGAHGHGIVCVEVDTNTVDMTFKYVGGVGGGICTWPVKAVKPYCKSDAGA
jgi:hypothetical protein